MQFVIRDDVRLRGHERGGRASVGGTRRRRRRNGEEDERETHAIIPSRSLSSLSYSLSHRSLETFHMDPVMWLTYTHMPGTWA